MSVPSALKQLAVINHDSGEWFDLVEVDSKKAIEGCAMVEHIEQNQTPAFAVRRLRHMRFKSAVQKNNSISIFVGSDPCSTGVAVFWV
jgi:hypothetical protein